LASVERSTRCLRLTDVGSEVLEYAHRGAEITEAIDNIASNHLSKVSGNLRLAAPWQTARDRPENHSVVNPRNSRTKLADFTLHIRLVAYWRRFISHVLTGPRQPL